MTRTAVVPTRVLLAGVAQPAQVTGIADGHKFKNNGLVIVECDNTDAANANKFTFLTPGKQLGQLAIADLEVEVAASSVEVVGPFPVGTFNQGDDEVYLDYDETNYASQKIRIYQID